MVVHQHALKRKGIHVQVAQLLPKAHVLKTQLIQQLELVETERKKDRKYAMMVTQLMVNKLFILEYANFKR